jgi:hypothetical protein
MPWSPFGKKADDPRPAGPTAYASLREKWLLGEVIRLAGPGEQDSVIAVLFDKAVGDGHVTFVAAEDGTASMYTSRGGGIIGSGRHASAAAAALGLVGCAQSYVSLLPLAKSFPLPQAPRVAFHIVTRGGVHSAAFDPGAMRSSHRLSPLETARGNLVTQTRLLDERRQRGALGPHEIDAQVFADGGICVRVPPDPTPTWLTANGLKVVLAIGHANGDRLAVHIEPGDEKAQAGALRAIDAAGYTGAFSEVPKMIGYKNRMATIHHAVESARADIVLEQLALGTSIEARDGDGYTPLLLAAMQGRTAIFQVLVQRHADFRARDRFQNTALIYAAQVGDVGIARHLYILGADLGAKGQNGLTALQVATQCGHREVAQLLQAVSASE